MWGRENRRRGGEERKGKKKLRRREKVEWMEVEKREEEM